MQWNARKQFSSSGLIFVAMLLFVRNTYLGIQMTKTYFSYIFGLRPQFLIDQIIEKEGKKSHSNSWMALFNPMVQGEDGALAAQSSLRGGPVRAC